jgi:FkbM family methyltransferase
MIGRRHETQEVRMPPAMDGNRTLRTAPIAPPADIAHNAALAALARGNRRAQARAAQFRADLAVGQARANDVAQLKQQFPFHGLLPCHAAGYDFVMFTANDDVVAWEYFWRGPDGYEADSLTLWAGWCRSPGVVLDIGGYSGVMAIIAARANPANTVHLFEPMARTVERASINIKLNRLQGQVTLHACAASDSAGAVQINTYRDADFPGTGNSIYAKPGKDVIDRVDVRSARVDDVLPEIVPTAIKIDVEGHELACLHGMAATIARARPRIIIEVWDHDRAAVMAFLDAHGYRVGLIGSVDGLVANFAAVPR